MASSPRRYRVSLEIGVLLGKLNRLAEGGWLALMVLIAYNDDCLCSFLRNFGLFDYEMTNHSLLLDLSSLFQPFN